MTLSTSVPDDGPFALSISVSADHPRAALAVALQAVLDTSQPALDGETAIQVWLEEARAGDNEILESVGFRAYRDLLQLRRPLPAAPSGIETRSFRPGQDEDAFIEVNNRAFSWHPEQSGLTREKLAATMAEPWFDPEGFRLLELDDRLAGFCWTKVHADHDPVLGEIYVIAVDPDFHGRGLGGPMTLAGLEHLAAAGITMANLYVEADNHAARRVYERLGFAVHSTNRAFR